MRIGEAAKELGLSVSNIRFYEKKGLLSPVREQENQYRDYTSEDILRLKQIMLYRKMDLPIETIHDLLENKADFPEVLREQEEKLRMQMETLQGSMELCRKLAQEEDERQIDVDFYLNYVKEEETGGQKFPQLEELLEDMTAFSKIGLFRGDRVIGRFFENPWAARAATLLLAATIVFTLVWVIVEAVNEGGRSAWMRCGIFGLILFALICEFLRYRRNIR